MINLKFFASINKQLQKSKSFDISPITFFGALPLVVLIGDFYKFATLVGKALWNKPHKKKEIQGKTL